MGNHRRRCALADLKLHLAHAACVPLMRICRIGAPGQAVLRFIVAVVRNGELDTVKGLFVRLHHIEDDFLVIVVLDSRKVQVGRKPSLAADEYFPQAGAALEGQPVQNVALG